MSEKEGLPSIPLIENGTGDAIMFPFSPPIYKTTVPPEAVENLLEEAQKIRDKNDPNDRMISNVIVGDSYKYSEKFRVGVEQYIVSKATKFLETLEWIYQMNFGSKRELELMNIWSNFTYKQDFNAPHVHSGDISFVIYTQVPEEIFDVAEYPRFENAGKIVFQHGDKNSPFHYDQIPFKPYAGLMLLFPSSLKHLVPPFWTDSERVSVSGNIAFKDGK